MLTQHLYRFCISDLHFGKCHLHTNQPLCIYLIKYPECITAHCIELLLLGNTADRHCRGKLAINKVDLNKGRTMYYMIVESSLHNVSLLWPIEGNFKQGSPSLMSICPYQGKSIGDAEVAVSPGT